MREKESKCTKNINEVNALQTSLPVWHRAKDSNVFKSALFKLFKSHFPDADVIFMLNYTEHFFNIRDGRCISHCSITIYSNK